MRTTVRVLLILHLLVIGALAMAYLSPFVHPETFAVPSLVSLVFPFLVGLNILFGIVWLSMKKYYALMTVAMIVLGWNHHAAYLQINAGSSRTSGETLTIATFNAFQFNKSGDAISAKRLSMQNTLDAIGRPDILCVQEGGEVTALDDQFGYAYARRVKGSFSKFYSKYKVIEHQRIPTEPHASLSSWFDVIIGNDTIRVFHLHLRSNQITVASERLIEEPKLRERSTWMDALRILKRYVAAASIRAHQADMIAGEIEKSPYPVLACGDLNDVPLSYAYSAISRNLRDSFIEKGTGLGITYAGKIKGLRIDYVLVDNRFGVLSHQVPALSVSDHYPVVVKVALPSE